MSALDTMLPTAPGTAPDREIEIRVFKPWYSGFCGPGPECRDGRQTNKVGESIRHCLGEAINGDKAVRRVVPCACACHQEQ
ncbi:hypothetical protein [Nocardioides pakistanensis]